VVDADVLLRAGISDSLVPRTLQALKTLDLITDEGRPSDTFEGIRLAPTAEYQSRLAEWLTAAYADALAFVDPSTDDEIAIRDAFRKYIPTGQQSRMVSLFMGLFTAAGVMPPRQKQAGAKSPQPKQSVKPIVARATKAAPRAHSSFTPQSNNTATGQSGGLPSALSGLLATLPPEGGRWTQERRDKFVSTFGVLLDYCYEIGEPQQAAPHEDEAADGE